MNTQGRASGWRAAAKSHSLDMAVAFGVCVLLGVLSFCASQSMFLQRNVLLPGVSINGIDVSGLDPDSAAELVIAAEEERLLGLFSLALVSGDVESHYDAQSLGVATNARQVVENVMRQVKNGGIFSRASAHYRLRQGVQVPVSLVFDRDRIRELCAAHAEQVYRQPINAVIRLNQDGDAFAYEAEQPGRYVDEAALFAAVWARLEEGDLQARISFDSEELPPAIALADLQGNIMKLSEHGTKLQPQHEQDCAALAARLNGAVLFPGEDFSFLRQLYPEGEIAQQDYDLASQLAGTFYDAALLAGADKVSRKANDTPVDYMAMGLDARVDGETDLVMRNNERFPMYVLAGVRGDRLVVEVHGRVARVDEALQIRSVVDQSMEPGEPTEVVDPSLPAGERRLLSAARPGYRVSAYREVLKKGVVVDVELLSIDVYPAAGAVYRIGE